MKQLFSIKKETEKILKQLNLKDVKISYIYNFNLTRVVAKVSYTEGIENLTLTLGKKLFKQSDDVKIKVLKHEIAHIYDRHYNKRTSKHDKIFKDLCEKLYGDRTIGQATTKGWDNWNR